MLNSYSLLLSLDDFLNENFLVLEHVTFGQEIKLLIKGRVDFSHSSILLEESSEGSLFSDPEDFLGHSGVLGSSSLTNSHMSSLSLLLESLVGSESGVDGDVFLLDESSVDVRLDVVSGGPGFDVLDFLWVDPNSVLSAFKD